jgi:hypothetical protein
LFTKTQYFFVDVKGAKRDDAGQQNLPGSVSELPALLHAYAQGIKNKQQEKAAMEGSHYTGGFRVVELIFQGHGCKEQDQKGDAFHESYNT